MSDVEQGQVRYVRVGKCNGAGKDLRFVISVDQAWAWAWAWVVESLERRAKNMERRAKSENQWPNRLKRNTRMEVEAGSSV